MPPQAYKMWSWSKKKPALRFGLASVRFGLTCAAVIAAGVALFTWWPNDAYKPIIHPESVSGAVSEGLEKIGSQIPKLEDRLNEIPVVRSALSQESVGGEQSGAPAPPSGERISAQVNTPVKPDSVTPAPDMTPTYAATAPTVPEQPDTAPTVPAISPGGGGAVPTEVRTAPPPKMEDVPQKTPKEEPYPGPPPSPIIPHTERQQPPTSEPVPPPGRPAAKQVCLQTFPVQCR